MNGLLRQVFFLEDEFTADGIDHFALPVAAGREMEIAVVTCLPAKGDVHVDTGHGFFCKTTSGFLHAIADYAPYGDIFSFMPFRSPCFFLVAVLSAVVSSVWAQEGYVTQDLTSEWT